MLAYPPGRTVTPTHKQLLALRRKARRVRRGSAEDRCGASMGALLEAEACDIKALDLRCFTGVRGTGLEGPKGRRAAQLSDKLGPPVTRFLVENSHGDVLS
jgi:hypothetical protein